MANELGNADEMIKAGLRAAGVPRETAQTPHGNPGSGSYSGADRTEAEGMIREALRNAPPPMRAGPLDNTDERARQIGEAMLKASDERIEASKPYERPTEPAKSAEDWIRAGLNADRARAEADARAKAEATPKIRRSWK